MFYIKSGCFKNLKYKTCLNYFALVLFTTQVNRREHKRNGRCVRTFDLLCVFCIRDFNDSLLTEHLFLKHQVVAR